MNVVNYKPVEFQLQAGRTYYWCSCGKSGTQPFCDGAHKGSEFEPLAFTADEDKTVWLCNCKQAQSAPFCDGSHTQL